MRPTETGTMICGYSYQRRWWPGCGLAYALWGALPNLFVCIFGLAVVAFISEWRIRRREESQAMTSSAKRPWYRCHLLTAVLMMLAAGGMLWANAKRDYEYLFNGRWRLEWGFPLRVHDDIEQPLGTVFNEYVKTVPYFCPHTDWGVVAMNADIAIVIVVALGVLVERLIRRREGRKP